MGDLKEFRYEKNTSDVLDQEFIQAHQYGKIKIAKDVIFWKKGLNWYCVALEEVSRIFRRIHAVNTKMCCGNVNFDTQKLVLILKDGTELELVLGDGMAKEAEAMYDKLKEQTGTILFGKE